MSYATSLSQDFLLELGQLSATDVAALRPSFDNLPASPYADGAFRLRRYSHFLCNGSQLTQLPTKSFMQDASINQFQGNVERVYPEIEADLVSSRAFFEMFLQFKHIASIPHNTPIEVHQMRIFAQQGATDTAPEGIHQDGFDRLAVFALHRENITGGNIRVHQGKNSDAFVNHCFDNGEFVVINDQRFFHSADPIVPINAGSGFMDVFVLTA